MAVHVDNVNDLAKTNEGVAVSLNHFTDWNCRKGVTEAPLTPGDFKTRISDFAKTALKGDSVALNYTHLVLSLAATVPAGTPGNVIVEIIDPNIEGIFQILRGQTLTWSPGSGKPCLMLFTLHYQLPKEAHVFRVRMTNSGIPTKGTFCRCHAYWGVHFSNRLSYYRDEPARMIELDVGFQKSYLKSLKQVREYVKYTFDTTRSDPNPQLCSKSSMSVVPESSKPAPHSVIAPTVRVASESKASDLDEWVKNQRATVGEPNKPTNVDSGSESSSAASIRRRSQRGTKLKPDPMKPDHVASGQPQTFDF